jgi:hypothetical protein
MFKSPQVEGKSKGSLVFSGPCLKPIQDESNGLGRPNIFFLLAALFPPFLLPFSFMFVLLLLGLCIFDFDEAAKGQGSLLVHVPFLPCNSYRNLSD